MGFGIRNCSGWAAFNNFDIQTRPGEKPKEAEGRVADRRETVRLDHRAT